MPHQSLYRRFRPQRFTEVVGQPHLIRALRNAVSEDRVGHAYLLSGPRGTGKTSTARILAKALNCEALGDGGEPCGNCDSCTAVASGTSMDLIELDAASNNSVNHIRDMTEKAALVSAGRRKVYLLDEVHMLSTAASNALLKTLEEPPSHVVFILATTDPQKVLPTIRSRTQQFELSLVGADEMAPHVRAVAEAAGAPVDDRIIEYVTQRGGGSVRDALSALDTVLAAGGIPDDRTDVGALVQALANDDLAATLIAVADATSAGVDARDLAERTARRLRDMFLVGAGVEPAELPPTEVATARELGDVMGRRANVRALETLGEALAQMPQSADRRLTLETALVGLLADGLIGTTAAPARAEAAAPARAGAAAPPARPAAPVSSAPSLPDASATSQAAEESAGAETSSEPEPPSVSEPPSPSPGSGATVAPVSAAELQAMWADQVATRLKPHAQGLFIDAEVISVDRNVVHLKVPHQNLLERARKRKNEIEAVLSDRLDRNIRVEVEAGASAEAAAAPSPPREDAPAVEAPSPIEQSSEGPGHQPDSGDTTASAFTEQSKVQRIVDRFPGSVVVHVDDGTT